MITSLSLENFKSIRSMNGLPLTTINIFIGQNGSGKSTISQSIALLKQSGQNINWSGDLINLDSFQNVVNNQSKSDTILIGFSGNYTPSNETSSSTGIYNSKYSFGITIDQKGLHSIGYEIDADHTVSLYNRLKRTGSSKSIKPIIHENHEFTVSESFKLDNFLAIHGGNSGDDYEQFEKYRNALDEILHTFQNQLKKCYIISATRGFDQSSYQLLDEVDTILTSRGVTRQAEMSVTALAHNFHILDKITDYAKQVIPDVNIQVRNLPQKRARIVNKDEFGEYGITDEGFGLNQAVYLFMQLAFAPKFSSIFIDEPEISLHPASQSRLANVLVNDAINEKHQLVITTHSEHILLGILEKVMEKKLSSKHVNVYYFEKVNGVSKIKKLKVNEKGELEGGMKGFFEADLDHIEKFLDSLKQ